MLVSDLLDRNARFFGNRESVVEPGGRASTWHELSDRTEALAGAFGALLLPGERLAMLADNCAEFIDFFFACAKSGIVGAATNVRHSEAELVEYLRKIEPRALLVQAVHLARGKSIADGVPSITHLIGFGGEHDLDLDLDRLRQDAEVRDRPTMTPDDPYQLCPTSGTTGTTKAVVLTHRNATTAMLAYLAEYDAREGDTWLQMNPLYLNAGGPAHLSHVLWKGGRTVVVPGGFEPTRFLEAVDEYRVTHTSLVPTMVRMVLDLGADRIADHDLGSLRSVVFGGAPVTAPFLAEAERVFGRVFHSTYGMTETYSTGLILRMEAFVDGDGEVRADRLATAGRPFLHLDARVVDDAGNDVAEDGDAMGEIWLKGDSISAGYFRDPEATADSRRGEWFRTGDLAVKDAEGYIRIVDRLKDVIITGGLNVATGEIEAVLAGHPSVAEVAVIGLPHPTWGETVHAVIVPRDTAQAEDQTPALVSRLSSLARDRLGNYKRPKTYTFARELPRNSTGKVLKRELRQTVSAGELIQAE